MEEYEQLCEDLTAPLTECGRIRDELESLTGEVRRISYTLGSDAQNKIVPPLLQAEFLARASGEVLAQFSHPRFTSMPRREWVLESLRSLVSDSARASLAVTIALRNNPMPEGPAPETQPPAASEVNHAAAEYEMAWHLAEASNLLESSALICRNVYDWVVWDLDVADQAPNQRNLAHARAAREAATHTAVAEVPAKIAPRAAPRR
ncbi:hypothetical protein [Streptomyces sp. NBC_01244]|uniref:hypothetical protein n=1 Tax=Streptomyces sp. NBC_01244 TaxID=2903797 RepID=UPI002E15C4E0|nr:hypothetical protein OG247_31690 [Streptomyces sp. NBC_01244]